MEFVASFFRKRLLSHSRSVYLILTLLLLNKVLDEDRASESQLSQDIKFTRHRLELMFRVAHMNRDKTKLLVKSIEPKEPSEGTMIRPPRYNPRQILDKTKVRVFLKCLKRKYNQCKLSNIVLYS